MSYTVDTDKTKLDIPLVHSVLSASYWAEGRSRETVESAIQGSLCFGVYFGEEQVGFARVITDYATFAYLADVFVVENHRGRGLGKQLVETVLSRPGLQACSWALFTRDAHALYAPFGFERPAEPERLMRRKSISVQPLTEKA